MGLQPLRHIIPVNISNDQADNSGNAKQYAHQIQDINEFCGTGTGRSWGFFCVVHWFFTACMGAVNPVTGIVVIDRRTRLHCVADIALSISDVAGLFLRQWLNAGVPLAGFRC
jgi:hypothetical protein